MQYLLDLRIAIMPGISDQDLLLQWLWGENLIEICTKVFIMLSIPLIIGASLAKLKISQLDVNLFILLVSGITFISGCFAVNFYEMLVDSN